MILKILNGQVHQHDAWVYIDGIRQLKIYPGVLHGYIEQGENTTGTPFIMHSSERGMNSSDNPHGQWLVNSQFPYVYIAGIDYVDGSAGFIVFQRGYLLNNEGKTCDKYDLIH